MNILIIGDYPLFSGGVTNYTRPLAQELSKNHNVHYLYSSTRIGSDSFFKKRKIINKNFSNFNFSAYELVNGDAQYKNYNNISVDNANWFDQKFKIFLKDLKIDIIHVNEIFGFSTSMINEAISNNIKVFITVHEYWWLCLHRVMVDYNRKVCDGPFSMQKCAYCVSFHRNNTSYFFNKNIIKLKNDFPLLINFLCFFKNFFKKANKKVLKEKLNFNNLDFINFSDKDLEYRLEARLRNNISTLNNCTKVIGVSSDVKNILKKYGVMDKKIIVQHIGSTIAKNKIIHKKKLNPKMIIFGFIGGVTYYKGVHQLIQAFIDLDDDYKSKSKIKIYGKYNEPYYNAMLDLIKGSDNIEFYGKFSQNDLESITNKIDISVLPSLCADTAPQTIFESFNAGLPIIAPDIGGFPDFILNNKNGLIYRGADVTSLKKCLIKIIDNPKLIDIFKSNITQSKNIEENVTELINLYESN